MAGTGGNPQRNGNNSHYPLSTNSQNGYPYLANVDTGWDASGPSRASGGTYNGAWQQMGASYGTPMPQYGAQMTNGPQYGPQINQPQYGAQANEGLSNGSQGYVTSITRHVVEKHRASERGRALSITLVILQLTYS